MVSSIFGGIFSLFGCFTSLFLGILRDVLGLVLRTFRGIANGVSIIVEELLADLWHIEGITTALLLGLIGGILRGILRLTGNVFGTFFGATGGVLGGTADVALAGLAGRASDGVFAFAG